MDKNLEIAKEVEKLTLEGLTLTSALTLATRMYNNSIVSIAPNEDIDNGEIYDIQSGKTLRKLGGM